MNQTLETQMLCEIIYKSMKRLLSIRKKQDNFKTFGDVSYYLRRLDSFLINDFDGADESLVLLISIFESILINCLKSCEG